MFQHSLSLHSKGRSLGGFALGLSVLGQGFAFAQDRRPAQPQPAERPAMERPMQPMERPARPERPMQPLERPTRPERPVSPGVVTQPTARTEVPIRPATNAIIAPRPLERSVGRPTRVFWQHRDIMAEIQAMARRGFIAVHPVGEDLSEFTGVSDFPAGWTAYGFRVPPGESIHIRLHHPNEGWFRLAMVNKWGSLEQGMLQNLIPTGNPEVKYTNPTKEPRSVYVIVDDPGWMSGIGNPFNMKVTRSWDPTKKKVDAAPIVTGIWAQKKEDAKPDAAKEAPAPVQPKG